MKKSSRLTIGAVGAIVVLGGAYGLSLNGASSNIDLRNWLLSSAA